MLTLHEAYKCITFWIEEHNCHQATRHHNVIALLLFFVYVEIIMGNNSNILILYITNLS